MDGKVSRGRLENFRHCKSVSERGGGGGDEEERERGEESIKSRPVSVTDRCQWTQWLMF